MDGNQVVASLANCIAIAKWGGVRGVQANSLLDFSRFRGILIRHDSRGFAAPISAVLLIGALPPWPYIRGWGYCQSVGLRLTLVI